MRVLALITLFMLFSPQVAMAQDLPAYCTPYVKKTPLIQVGSGTYRKLGFRIYNATLFAPDGQYDPAKPYALQLQYTRSLSKETLMDAVYEGIKEQEVADEETLARWKKTLDEVLPAVEDEDVILGLSVPGKGSWLFHNGKVIAHIKEPALATAFFGIWVGKKADEKLYAELLGNTN